LQCGHLYPENFCLAFPYARGRPSWQADFRAFCADFRVEEELGFALSGQGEHLCLLVRKEGQNSRWVASSLARAFAVDETAVGYCGLKDRWAITSQWFSLYLPGRSKGQPPLELPAIDGCEILQQCWHSRKLRRGEHAANRFSIRLRNFTQATDIIESRLQSIRIAGVPNYFGEQRFGRDAGNLVAADRLFRQSRPRFRGQRDGLYLSAARAWLFNLVLAERVRDLTWNIALTDETVPEGPLWGRGRNRAVPAVATLEGRVLADWSTWCQAMEYSGLKQERRSLVLLPVDLQWHWQGNDLSLNFALPPGTFATSVLREIALLNPCNAVL